MILGRRVAAAGGGGGGAVRHDGGTCIVSLHNPTVAPGALVSVSVSVPVSVSAVVVVVVVVGVVMVMRMRMMIRFLLRRIWNLEALGGELGLTPGADAFSGPSYLSWVESLVEKWSRARTSVWTWTTCRLIIARGFHC